MPYKDPEKRRANDAKRREALGDELKQYKYDWAVANKEANPEKVAEQNRATKARYRENHPDADKIYRETHQEQIKASNAEYRRTHQAERKAYADGHKEERRIRELRHNYGLSLEDYELLLKSQDYRCAICGSTEWGETRNVPHVDHDHSCCDKPARSCGECIRGLLCGKCNRGLGDFRDNIDFLLSAVEYLTRWAHSDAEDDVA